MSDEIVSELFTKLEALILLEENKASLGRANPCKHLKNFEEGVWLVPMIVNPVHKNTRELAISGQVIHGHDSQRYLGVHGGDGSLLDFLDGWLHFLHQLVHYFAFSLHRFEFKIHYTSNQAISSNVIKQNWRGIMPIWQNRHLPLQLFVPLHRILKQFVQSL